MSRKVEECDSAAQKLSQEFGGECISIPADLSNLEGIENLVKEISSKESQLDILINNAGASWGAPIDEYPEMGWDKVMDTNVKGVFFLTQKLLPLLRESGSKENPSRVVNVGSIDGIKTGMFDAFAYGPSKAALHHLTRILAASLIKENIIVNAIAPGPFPTKGAWSRLMPPGFEDFEDTMKNKIPMKRFGERHELENLASYLMSDGSAYINGEVITIDGGEWLAGAGEFSDLTKLPDSMWKAMAERRKKK